MVSGEHMATREGELVLIFEPVRENTNNLGSDHVRHKAGYTLTEDG